MHLDSVWSDCILGQLFEMLTTFSRCLIKPQKMKKNFWASLDG